MMIIYLLVLLIQVVVSAGLIYHYFLLLSGGYPGHKVESSTNTGELLFAIALPAHNVVGIAEVVVNHRILGLEFDRPFQLYDGLVKLAEPVVNPAKAVDDKAVVRPQLDGATDHLQGALKILALLNP